MQSLHYKQTRFFFVLFIFIILYCFVLVNLYVLQIKQFSFFKNLGEKQYNITMQVLPARALLYDRNNIPVALNKDSVAAFILPKALIAKNDLLQFLKEKFPAAFERFEQYQNKSFMYVKRNLSDNEIESIHQSGLVDVHLLKESNRYYPYESLATVVGITDIDNQGLMGIELQCNKRLQGSPTTYQLKKDAKSHHFYFGKETKQQGQDGIPLTLSIDAILQFKMQTILQDAVQEYGSIEAGAIAINPTNGEILTLVSVPTFNPNNVKDLDLQMTKCRPVMNCFESGSVIKAFCALAALQEGVVTLDEMIDCENTKETKLDNLRIRTVYPDGIISFLEVMQRSNNIGIVKVMKRIGTDLYDYYKLLGFGEMTGLNFPGEQKGFVNHPDNWSAWSIQSLSYGYEMTTSLLQLARAMSLIVNGGYLITPTLIKDQKTKKTGPLISQKTLDDMKILLQSVIDQGSGARAQIPGYIVYGKTGTANILIDGVYDEDRHLYTFVGAVEKNNYLRVVCCYLKDSKRATYASMITAPVFKKLAEAMIMHDMM
ncbi:penicillin-binding protein 2 [Candidatus Babeliales bacterium]|nr:penicillin-binding protein 2 [Candidatus Babeliales bacterium]